MIARHANVRDPKALQAAFDDGVAEFGYIDTVVANAGILLNRVDEPDPEAVWNLGIGVMLTGVWNTLQIASTHMMESDRCQHGHDRAEPGTVRGDLPALAKAMTNALPVTIIEPADVSKTVLPGFGQRSVLHRHHADARCRHEYGLLDRT